MRAGSLSRRIHVQVKGAGRLPSGQLDPAQEWINLTVRPIWADFRAQTGVQVAASNTEVSESRYSIRVRYRRDIEPNMRVVEVDADGGLLTNTYYDIRAVIPDVASRRYTDLVCETRIGNG